MFLLDLLDLYQAVLKEALRAFSILKNEREMLKLEHDYLTSPKKLTELQKLYFDDELINYESSKFGELIMKENELLIIKKNNFLSNE